MVVRGKATVKDIDRGYKEIVRSLGKIDGSHTKVGIMEGIKAADGETDLAAVAAFNEFGTSRIPSRPFMRQSFDKNQDKIDNIRNEQIDKMYALRIGPEKALAEIGAWFTGVIQKEITTGQFAPNSPRTIEEKGSSKPLVDTGRLRQSIRHEEVMK